ncbi:MAG TPA: DUF6573 family protein [Rubrobacter sp.]|nr:DUF6573 family protein [Rubrobacter sp.]
MRAATATLRDLRSARDRARAKYLAATRQHSYSRDTAARLALAEVPPNECGIPSSNRTDAMTDHSTPADFWGEPIHVYTRADALADDVLVDVTLTAREASFRIPVALTANVWADVNDLSGPYVLTGQSTEGRLWDLLFMAANAARRPENRDRSEFVYALIMPVGTRNYYRAKCHVGPGDEGEPVVTILRPNED